MNLTQSLMLTMVLVSVFLGRTFAADNKPQFNELVQINHSQNTFANWRQLVVNPRNNQQSFIINTMGQMFLVDDFTTPQLVLDLNTDLPKGSLPINFTAIELHPNFALRDQPGYGVFYTAHLETLDQRSKTKRIQENNDELILKFDAVITEWQFSAVNYQTVDLNTKREVLRIGVPDNSMTIQQMSFSPYIKSWNEGFGLLYIALNGQEQQSEPLYSGVLLRINPAKFGLRSFTVPSSNPYLKNHEIRDEIYLLGAQKIKQFIWPDKSKNNLLLSHQYKDKFLLSLVNFNSDWRKIPPSNIIYQTENPIKDTILYRGRYLSRLRNKLLILTQVNEQWLVESLNLKSAVGVVNSLENKPELEWQFNPQQLFSNSDIALSYDLNGEMLILDETLGRVFQLPQENTAMTIPIKESNTPKATQEKSKSQIYILFVFIIAMIIVIFFFKRNKVSAKAIVRAQFAQLELSESQHQIGFYHRHKHSPSAIINIDDIVLCEVMLNDISVWVVNRQLGYGFDNEKDENLRDIFSKEKVDKMIDGKIRQITLSFTDVNKTNYVTCLYMRKGSDRVTKKSYSAVIDDLIDWCWLIATKINPEETKQRKVKAIISSNSAQNIVKPKQDEINSQAARPTAMSQQDVEIKSALATPKITPIEINNETDINQHDSIDTALVDALAKLVDLKQQGFLTQEEYIKAKENLLSGLFEK